jgi:uroporphyrinogen-III synthase
VTRLPLQGIGVLVTRPRQQGATLCRLLETAGALAVHFPAVDIVPIERITMQERSPLARYDLIVFSSANAVRFGAALLQQRRDLTLAAIGPATARALNQAGYRVAVQSAEGADSESLLAHPKLSAVAGSRVLIVKGSGGREFLERELVRRGAQVAFADVYRRECSRPDRHEIESLERRFAARELHVLTATSLDIGTNLAAIATPALRHAFDGVPWVVPSARIAEGLRERGVRAPCLLARSASDQDLVSTIVSWREAESGA